MTRTTSNGQLEALDHKLGTGKRLSEVHSSFQIVSRSRDWRRKQDDRITKTDDCIINEGKGVRVSSLLPLGGNTRLARTPLSRTGYDGVMCDTVVTSVHFGSG